jgi:hypothetical protein
VTRPRPKPPVEIAVVDEHAVERRYRSLSMWFLLTQEGVQLTHSGSVRQRLEALEQAIDQRGLRQDADRHLRHLAAGRRRWPSGDPYGDA